MTKNKPFRNIYKRQETTAMVRERQRQHRVAVIGVAIITVVCIIGIGTIAYFIHIIYFIKLVLYIFVLYTFLYIKKIFEIKCPL